MNDVRYNYKEILAEIAEQDLLGNILSQILGYDVSIAKFSKDLPELIRQSEYALS